jgi:hypothetical protein
MGEMQMPIPDNTLPMMTGQGPFGAIEMGGMFTSVKVREGLARNDYRDPGWYDHPKGTVSFEWTGPVDEPVRRSENPGDGVEVQVRKPGRQDHH